MAMALKTCRECGVKVRARDGVCPNCGVHYPTASNPIVALSKSEGLLGDVMRRSVAAAILVVLVGMILIG